MILSRCTICRSKERENIDAALSAGEPQNEICARFTVAPGPLSRHNQRHRLEQEFDVSKSRPARGSLMAKLFEEARQEISAAKKSGDPIALNRANKRMNYAQALHRESMVAQRRAFEQGLAERVKKEAFGQHGRAQPVSPLKEITFVHKWDNARNQNEPMPWSKPWLAEALKQFVRPELVRSEIEQRLFRLKCGGTEMEMGWRGLLEPIPQVVQLASYFLVLWLESGTVPSELAEVSIELIKAWGEDSPAWREIRNVFLAKVEGVDESAGSAATEDSGAAGSVDRGSGPEADHEAGAS